jgi:hypothetical protein
MEPLDRFFGRAANLAGLTPHAPPLEEAAFAVLLSFVLQCILALVYKRTYRGGGYTQDYVHTLIILGTVSTAIVQGVRGDGATAFGIFAAFTVIRFGHGVKQSRDIGFVFLAMTVGLALGARHYWLGAALGLGAALVIFLFSWANLFPVKRRTHSLRIRLTNDLNYDTVFEECFDEFLLRKDLLGVEPVQAGMLTELKLHVSLKDPTKPGAFVSRLQQLNGNNRVYLKTAAPTESMGE